MLAPWLFHIVDNPRFAAASRGSEEFFLSASTSPPIAPKAAQIRAFWSWTRGLHGVNCVNLNPAQPDRSR
jgi:hypothetical protein